jgi:hypothetical protein
MNDRASDGLLDFSLAANEGSVGVHLDHLLGQGTVGTSIGGSGHDDGKVEQLAKLSVGHHVVAIQGGVPVTSKLVEASLKVEDQEKLLMS